MKGISGVTIIISRIVIFNESLMLCLKNISVGTCLALFTNKGNSSLGTNSLIRKYSGDKNANSKKSFTKKVVYIEVKPSKKLDEKLDMPPLENVTDYEARSPMQKEDKVTSTPIQNYLLTQDM